MSVSLVAALACMMAAPSSPSADASIADSAMSLPAELAPLSSPAPPPSEDATLPAADWSALVSRFDQGGSCYLMPNHTRTPRLRAPLAGAGRHVAAGAISGAPELLVSDGHAPILWPARLGLAPSFVIATLALPPTGTPPSPPGSRIDRPPRA